MTDYIVTDTSTMLIAVDAIKAFDKPFRVSITKRRDRRSLEQNSMLRGIYQVMSEYTGHTPEELMDLSFDELGLVEEKMVLGKLRRERISTAKLDVKQMGNVIDMVLAWAAGYNLPTMREQQ